MTLLALLINLLILLIVLAIVFAIARLILSTLGYPQFTNIVLAIVLLIGLIWFLSMIAGSSTVIYRIP